VSTTALRAALRDDFVDALGSIDLQVLVERALRRMVRPRRDVAVISAGKAAATMARGALRAVPWAGRVLVVVPDGVAAHFDHPRVEVMRAAHPDPDGRSVVAATRAFEIAHDAELLISLISGGTSSLLVRPSGITLARYVRVVRALRLRGATIHELNVVRRHLCGLKGGGLGRAARGNVLTLVASDVLGSALHDVGSGPTVADPTSVRQARAVLLRFVPRLRLPRLHESVRPDDSRARLWRARVIASPEDLAAAMAARLGRRFIRVRRLPGAETPVEPMVDEYRALAARLRAGEAVVRAAEPSLRVPLARPGHGGRSTHLAACLASALPPGVAFLAGASDGVDGTSGTGGAIVDAELGRDRGALDRAIRLFETGPLIVRAGMALRLNPSGTNLADLHVLARASG